MKDVVLLYDTCCVYEIANTNYYLRFTGADVAFAAVDQKTVTAMEGFSLNADVNINEIDFADVRSLIIPGGDKRNLGTPQVKKAIRTAFERGCLVAAICAAVDVVEDAGVLAGLASTHTVDAHCVRDRNVITARANAYVDFGIEVAKYLDLFVDEADLQETIDFWKYFKRMQ